MKPTTLIISLNDVKWDPKIPCVRQDETEAVLLSDHVEGAEVMVEPDGVEPTTSCLQSRRSTN